MGHCESMAPRSGPTLLRQRWQPGLAAAPWDHRADRRRGIESSSRLGRHRWRVERSLSWLSCDRRLQVRWDRDSERFFAFVLLACALVCFKRL
jgi:hypothetical protein